MKNKYKAIILAFLIFSCVSVEAQVTFQHVYPTSNSINQSGRDVLFTSDGGYILAGMTMTSTPGDSDIYVLKTDYAGNITWTQQFGGALPDYVYSFIPTADNNYFILGFTMSYGSGSYDVWLIKMDPSGTVLWTKTYGTSAQEEGHCIIPTADGNYIITGRANNDALLMKIDPQGNTLWTQTYGGAQYETSHSVAQCNDGGYVLVGQTFSYGAGGADVYVIKTDGSGNLSWQKTFGGVYDDEGKYVLANSDGTIIIDGQISSSSTFAGLDINVIKTDASGNVIWNQTYGGNDKDVTHMIQHTSDGGYVITGISRSFGWINPDMWLVKIDEFGTSMWTKNYGSWYHDHCYAVKQTSDGGYVALGHQEDINNVTHVFFVKTDGSGQVGTGESPVANTFAVYPNPSAGIIHVDLTDYTLEPGTSVKICNALGEILFSEAIGIENKDKKVINLSNNQRGVYFVSVQSKNETTTKKIILE
ncbi:MAG: T9SS type A sorting domain-containing protein [Bacteroidia bacterium]